MTTGTVSGKMRSAAVALVRGLDDEQRAQAALPFADEAARRWLEYRPSRRAGVCLGLLSLNARKAAHRLLATALSDRAYAQAMAIIALSLPHRCSLVPIRPASATPAWQCPGRSRRRKTWRMR